MPYSPPLDDMRFVLEDVLDLREISKFESFASVGFDSVSEILEGSAAFVCSSIEPLNRTGDREGAKLENGIVRTAPGWQGAYKSLVEGGWSNASIAADSGGMGLPAMVGAAIQEMMHSANMAFALCPMLTTAAIKLIDLKGSQAQKTKYLRPLIEGTWTGTMVLTEAQAGSDLASVRTKAKRQGDTYLITGQKIFITYGDHDLTSNVVHIVLARTSDDGIKGLSLFIVPKFVVSDDGSLGSTNDVRCVSIEHKLGIHGSPTAVLSFGDNGSCIGELVGEEGRGLEYMFIMMNEARLSVGIQGLGIAERAYQAARQYADERVQGHAGQDGSQPRPIRHHPDVHRMLMLMRSKCEAMRGLSYLTAQCLDLSIEGPTTEIRSANHSRLGLLVPVTKLWCTEQACEISSLAVQVHGGMGYVEETGVAQHYRDARITTIYEGTTGIQANDLVNRKILRDNGATALELAREMSELDLQLRQQPGPEFATIRGALENSISAIRAAVEIVIDTKDRCRLLNAAHAVNIGHLFGLSLGCWMLARSALRAQQLIKEKRGHHESLAEKIGVAHFYAGQVMPEADARLMSFVDPSGSALALYPDHFDASVSGAASNGQIRC